MGMPGMMGMPGGMPGGMPPMQGMPGMPPMPPMQGMPGGMPPMQGMPGGMPGGMYRAPPASLLAVDPAGKPKVAAKDPKQATKDAQQTAKAFSAPNPKMPSQGKDAAEASELLGSIAAMRAKVSNSALHAFSDSIHSKEKSPSQEAKGR